MMKSTKLLSLFILLILPTLLFALDTGKISQIYFFGDSLSDSGVMNNAGSVIPKGQTPVYTTPRGHTWAYYLGKTINKPVTPNNLVRYSTQPHKNWVSGTLNGNDYAAGGAVTKGRGFGMAHHYSPASLTMQVTNFLAHHNPDKNPNNVYFIWIGANDLLLDAKKYKKESKLKQFFKTIGTINRATTNISANIKRLHKAGAKNIFILNLPPLGASPLLTKKKSLRHATDIAAGIFDTELRAKLAILHLEGIHVPIFNVSSLFDKIIKHIKTYGYYTEPGTKLTVNNYTDVACIDSKKNSKQLAISCRNWVPAKVYNKYVFADGVHPTDTAHRIIALHVLKFLQQQKT
jgi:outer membrane lipase/esterase